MFDFIEKFGLKDLTDLLKEYIKEYSHYDDAKLYLELPCVSHCYIPRTNEFKDFFDKLNTHNDEKIIEVKIISVNNDSAVLIGIDKISMELYSYILDTSKITIDENNFLQTKDYTEFNNHMWIM